MDFQQLTGLIPHLTVKGGVAALEYYKKALGAEELSRMPTPDGRVMHSNRAARELPPCQNHRNVLWPARAGVRCSRRAG